MRKFLFVLLALLLCLSFSAAAADETDILGKPFPEFTAMDTEGNTFTLSEALNHYEAVLINIWATWCPPCRAEMPFLNKAREQYGDRVAFIALTADPDDTLDKIEAYRQEMGLQFPMGRDEGGVLDQYIGADGIPVTVIVDRFGNAAFSHIGSFFGTDEIARVIEAFVGDSYTETAVLTEIPKDTSIRAFPVSAQRAIHVENENARCVLVRTADDPDVSQLVYVTEDDVAHLRLELSASDDPSAVTYFNMNNKYVVQGLLDTERNAYVIDQPMPDPETEDYYVYGCLTTGDFDEPDFVSIYLLPGEKYIEQLVEEMRSWGYDVSWEFAEPAREEWAQAKAYILHISDQNNEAVPGVTVNFCTDTACTVLTSDEYGLISFDGAPDAYHVQVLKVPEGYSIDRDFELYTDPDYGEWLVRIPKD